MRDVRARLWRTWRGLAMVLALLWPLAAADAQPIADALSIRLAEHDAARATQRSIDALHGRDGGARTVEDRALAAQLTQAREALAAADARRDALALAIARQREAQAGIVPLLHAMVDLLERSVAVDLPFEADARRERIAIARAALTRHDLSMADRFDAVVRAYRAELAYGYDAATTPATLELAGVERHVNLIRVGRVALYYVTDDGNECGAYRRDTRHYVALDTVQCAVVHAASDVQRLPFSLARLPLSVDAP